MMRLLRIAGMCLGGSILLVLAMAIYLFERPIAADEQGDIVKNGGFETPNAANVAAEWTLENKVKPKGTASLAANNVHSGHYSLKLEPNAKNKPWDLSHDPLALGQGFPAGALRGKKLYVSAWLAAEGDAAAALDVVALGGRVPALVELKQTSAKSGPVYREDVLIVPADAKFLVVDCVAQGTSGAAYFDDVYASPRGLAAPERAAASAERLSVAAAPLQASVTVDAARDIRPIPRTLYGMGLEWIWDGNGIWNARTQSLDPELVQLTKELGTTLLRFPGGLFADYYNWRNGVGPRGSRPKTASMPGDRDGSVHNFGTDEALAFADQTGAHLLITVNAGTGSAREAADWVRYVNHAGRRVEYWEVGNELYVKMGHAAFTNATMTPDQYARKFVEFAKAMRQADPGIKIGAIGDENFGALSPRAYGDWTARVLAIAGQDMDFLAIHNGYAPVILQDKGQSLRRVYSAMLAAPQLVRDSLATASRKIADLGAERSAHIGLAVTEWGPYFQITPGDRFVDHVKTLGSALYVASAMKAFLEAPRMEIATGFKLSDELFQGWIGKRGGHWVPKAPYYALQLYTRHFGTVLTSSKTLAPAYDSQPVGLVDALSNVPYLDVVSSRSEDGRTLYLMAINKNFDSAVEARIAISGRRPTGNGTAWTLNGTGIDANTGTQLFQAPGVHWAKQASDELNPRFDKGGPGEVTVTSKPVTGVAASFAYTFPAHSVTAMEIPVQ